MAGIAAQLLNRAKAEGFDDIRITRAAGAAPDGDRLRAFVAHGYHGDMTWLADTAERRASATAMWPAARTAIVMATSYAPRLDPLGRLSRRDTGVISVYALGRDYHEVIKGKLKRLAQWLAHETGASVKVFVDTAPLMEKPLAQRAGLGWQGKHTNLVSRRLGSWFFIGTILTDAELAADAGETDHCGSCHACLDICPTRAFPAPYQLDARRCISYLTIEHRGYIAPEFRAAMGNRIFGCDDCLAVCPWNKFAGEAHEAKLAARTELVAPRLAELLRLDDQAFRALFSGSPVKRLGRDRFIRNVLIAAGNSGDAGLLPDIEKLLGDASPLVRAMAVWALRRLAPAAEVAALRARFATAEGDAEVRREWGGP
jgi:epoxyqueuosine reductase